MAEKNPINVSASTAFSLSDVTSCACEVIKTINENTVNYSKVLTDFKRDYVFRHATTNVRLMELGATTLLISMISWKRKSGVLGTLRNSVIGYFSFGFVLVPEIYNPLINVKKVGV